MPNLEPSQKKRASKSTKVFQLFCTAFRSFPNLTPSCKLPATSRQYASSHIHGGTRMTGTLFGRRKAHISLAIQESPRSLPILLLELTILTAKLLQKMEPGHVRIALECEKHTGDKTRLIEEPLWTMFCNGRKAGYGTKRNPTDEDLNVMQLLHAVSMGAGSRDCETYYLLNPDGNSGPELSIFFVQI
ncbi:hypothetical protein AAC387_Pa02g4620 [Persea americana]